MAALALLLACAALRVTAPTKAEAKDYTTIGLQWIAPGDDGNVGTASVYDLRYSTVPVSGTDTLSWWNAATRVTGLPSPRPAGSTDSTRVSGLQPGTVYYFIIRAGDEVPNWSGFSNIAWDTTLSCNVPTTLPSAFDAQIDTARTQVDLSWTGTDPYATRIHVYRGTGSSGALTLRTTLSDPTATSFTDTQVSAGTTYRYYVALASGCADGPASTTLTVSLPGTPPPPARSTDAAKVHAYPNPSSGAASIHFVIHVPGSASQSVLIRLYDMSGRWIATVADGTYGPGDNTVSWARLSRTGSMVSPGYYEAIGTVGGTRVHDRVLLTP